MNVYELRLEHPEGYYPLGLFLDATLAAATCAAGNLRVDVEGSSYELVVVERKVDEAELTVDDLIRRSDDYVPYNDDVWLAPPEDEDA